MNCPPELADILVKLIEAGILRARAAAWAGDPQRCAAEADHIHNLPGLLTSFSGEGLRYYWEVERPAFLSHWAGESPAQMAPLWERLAGWVVDTPPRPAAPSAG